MIKLNNNKRFFLNIFSAVMIVYGAASAVSVLAAAYAGEETAMIVLAAAAGITMIPGIIIRHIADLRASNVRPRVSYLTVTVSWLAAVLLTAAVYFFSVGGSSWYDSVFDAAASLTTTGASALGIDGMPVSILLFRSILNWLGGAGIVLIAASILSGWDFSGSILISAEMPGYEYLSSSASCRNTCRRILRIYAAMTAAHFVLMLPAGMPVFTSLLTALSNISTSGMLHCNSGVITALPAAQKAIITFFSFTGSLNMSIFLALFYGRSARLRKDSEIIFYASRILITAAAASVMIAASGKASLPSAFGDSLMQTVSFFSTSGFIAADYTGWPMLCKIMIILQMFIGACAASTGGGIKNARIIIGAKSIRSGLFRHVHPNAVRPVKYNGAAVRSEHYVQANLYITLFMLVYIAGALLLSIDNKNESILDALSYSQAMITGTGTSFSDPAATGLASGFSPLSKIVMAIEMLCGRLEIYPLLMLLSGSFWRSDRNK